MRCRVRLLARRRDDGTCDVDVDAPGSIEVVCGTPPWLELSPSATQLDSLNIT